MKAIYRLRIQPLLSLEQAWSALEEAGIEILYGSEEGEVIELYVHLSSLDEISSFEWIAESSLHTLPPIDWEAQWAAHGQNFHDGFLHIDFEMLGREASCLHLQPGPGFGDLSHPTTRLMLKMLAKYVKRQTVIDIGCGSGILTLAAAALGSEKAYGIDIDHEALEHARQNAIINHLADRCMFCTPAELELAETPHRVLILINMIHSEQTAAWESLPHLHHLQGDCLASGIRKEERTLYLEKAKQWGWTLKSEHEEAGWLIFCFMLGKSSRRKPKSAGI